MPIDKNKIKYDYFTFEGAISKAEYQRSFMALFLIAVALAVLNFISGFALIWVYIFVPLRIILLIAMISITIRRLRDLGFEPLLCLLWIIPPFGLLLSLYLLIAEKKTVL